MRRPGVAKTPWSPAPHRPRDFHFSTRTHLFINGMMVWSVVVLREKQVDETDWILPTSFLALGQSLPPKPAFGHRFNRVCGFLFYDN